MQATPVRGLLSTLDGSHTDTLSWVTHTARNTLAGVDCASICVAHAPGKSYSVGATDPLAERADVLQHELGEGPSIDADLGVELVHSDDVGQDMRWRAYGARAAEIGIRSQTAIGLRSFGRTIGVLNLYSTQLGQLDGDVLDAARALAHDASVMLPMTRAMDDLSSTVPGSSDIDRATEIVMDRYQLDEDRAFQYLVKASQTGNLKLRQVARELVAQTSIASSAAAGRR